MYMIPLSVRYKAFESLCRRPPGEAARLGGVLLPLAWLGNKQQGEYSPQMVWFNGIFPGHVFGNIYITNGVLMGFHGNIMGIYI